MSTSLTPMSKSNVTTYNACKFLYEDIVISYDGKKFPHKNLRFGFCFSISINCSCLCQASGRLACTTTELSIARVATGDTSAFKSTIEP